MAIKFTQVTDHTNQRIINVASPTLDTDAANKVYVDNVAQGLTWKMAARAASTGNVTLTAPGATIDGVTLVNGDRVLLKNQTTASQNGIYTWAGASATMTRTTDFDTSAKVNPGAALSVAEGTVNADKTYVLVTDNPITLGTTSLTFSLMNGGSGTTYTAGNGITVTGGVIAVNPASGGGLLAQAGGLSIDTSVVVKKYAANIGDGSSTSITVTHNLATLDVIVELVEVSTGSTVYAEVTRTSVNALSVLFATAPSNGQYRIIVHA